MSANLTLGMRILLHLSSFDARREGYDLPVEVTQQGIAEALSVRQSDVSRALAKMRSEGEVEERRSSVTPSRAGRKQRLKVYFLSDRGRELARGLALKVLEMPVLVPPRKEGEPERRLRLGEVNALLGTAHSPARLAEMVSPEGVLSPGTPPAPVPPAPAPEPEAGFVGRRRELSELADRVRLGPESVIAVTGIPGVGKTTLARRLLSELRDRRSLYFQVREWPSYRAFLHSLRDFLARYGRRRLAGLLQRPGSPPMEDVLAAVSRDLEGLGAVLVLDDFHEAAGQPELRHLARELIELLPRLQPPSRLLLFSRSSPPIYDARHVGVKHVVWEYRLGGLDEPSSRELASRAGLPPEKVEAAFKATRGHPLSIQLLKGTVGAVGDFEDSRRFLQEEVIGKLPPGERALLQTLSVLRRPEPSEFLLGLTDDPLAFDSLTFLVSRSLVTSGDDRYGVHELVSEAASGRMPAPTRRSIHLRAASAYARLPGAENGAEAVHQYCRAEEFERAARLLLSLGGELIAEGKLEECRNLLDTVEPGAPASAAEGLRRLREDLLAEYGDWDAGYEYLFQTAVLTRALGVRAPHPGRRIRSEKEWQAALSDHLRGLEVLGKVGDAAGRCELLTSLGWMRLMRGELDLAEEAYREATGLSGLRECRDAGLKAAVGQGHVAWLRGDARAAAGHYGSALRSSRPREGADPRISCLNYLANLASAPEELERAAGELEKALSLCGTGRHRRERAYTLLHLGRLHALSKGSEQAGTCLSSALNEFRGIGDPHGVAYSQMALALLAQRNGEWAFARRQAIEASEDARGPELSLIRECALRLADAAGKGAGK